jgi:hypothetical protein
MQLVWYNLAESIKASSTLYIMIDVVAASGFLGIFGLRRGRKNTGLPPYVIRSHYVTMVDNKPRQVSHCYETCIRFCGVRVLF